MFNLKAMKQSITSSEIDKRCRFLCVRQALEKQIRAKIEEERA